MELVEDEEGSEEGEGKEQRECQVRMDGGHQGVPAPGEGFRHHTVAEEIIYEGKQNSVAAAEAKKERIREREVKL